MGTHTHTYEHNSIDFFMAMNCRNIFIRHSLTQHATKEKKEEEEVFATIYYFIRFLVRCNQAREKLKCFEFKWQLCIYTHIMRSLCLIRCTFILLRRVKFKPNELQSALNLHSPFVCVGKGIIIWYANFVQACTHTQVSQRARTLSMGSNGVIQCGAMYYSAIFWFWY